MADGPSAHQPTLQLLQCWLTEPSRTAWSGYKSGRIGEKRPQFTCSEISAHNVLIQP